MDIQELGVDFRDSAIALWQQAALTRPWNNPHDDFDRATRSASSVVLGVVVDGSVVVTAMVGSESDIKTTVKGKPAMLRSRELLSLKKVGDSWKIVAAQWQTVPASGE